MYTQHLHHITYHSHIFPFPLPEMALAPAKGQPSVHIFVSISHICPVLLRDKSLPLENPIGSDHPISLPFGSIFWHGKALYHLLLQERQLSGCCSNSCGNILEYDDKPENLWYYINLFGAPIWSLQTPNQNTSFWDPQMNKCTLKQFILAWKSCT